MPFVPGFEGNQFAPGTASYGRANNIYATSTYGKVHNMNPGEILQPTSIDDIKKVVKAAAGASPPIPIAIRTGGHQYSGACSTGTNGIQLDLKPTFRRPNIDLHVFHDDSTGKAFMRSSVSWTLIELYDFLLDNNVFLPTGQCAQVCLGGHVQTGGYGMLARSFGLLGDYVVELEIVDHTGEHIKVTKKDNPDLFYGLLGGSPGNFGVLTHFTVEVQEDSKHKGSKGLWIAFPFKKETLQSLLDILVERAENTNWERNYDLTVNVISRQANLLDIFPGSQSELKERLPDDVWDGKNNIADLLKFKYALIVVYAQWVNFGSDTYSPELFNRIERVATPWITKPSEAGWPMSAITSMWLFRGDREFPYPYVKRTQLTKSTSLSKDKWSEWFADRINKVVSVKGNGLWISAQLQAMGGNNSMFRRNANNGTAFTWRDSNVGGTWDVFYQPGTENAANAWQNENDQGSLTHFSKDELRLLWGSYGDWDMKKVWPRYYDPATYQKLQGIRKAADPVGIFTPNPFCVERAA